MKLSQKPSKIWIYGPLYVLLIFVLCAGTWSMLNPTQPEQRSPITVALAADRLPPCFTDNCVHRSPVFKLWPEAAIVKTLKVQDGLCADAICGLCEESERFVRDQPFAGDDCLSRLFDSARKHHFEQLKNLPKMPLFFNSGEVELSEKQSSDLKAFLNSYRGLKHKKGVLIIGRASKGGSNAANEELSYNRSSNIQIMLGELLGRDFKRDYVYFGAKPPQLTVADATALDINPESYRSVKVTGTPRPDYSLRLNQSVIVVVYDLEDGVFGSPII